MLFEVRINKTCFLYLAADIFEQCYGNKSWKRMAVDHNYAMKIPYSWVIADTIRSYPPCIECITINNNLESFPTLGHQKVFV